MVTYRNNVGIRALKGDGEPPVSPTMIPHSPHLVPVWKSHGTPTWKTGMRYMQNMPTELLGNKEKILILFFGISHNFLTWKKLLAENDQ